MGLFSRAPQRKVSVKSRGGKTPLLPASMQSFIAHRLTDLGGVAFAGAGLALFGALLTYDPKDPSLNTAGTNPVVQNFLGKWSN